MLFGNCKNLKTIVDLGSSLPGSMWRPPRSISFSFPITSKLGISRLDGVCI